MKSLFAAAVFLSAGFSTPTAIAETAPVRLRPVTYAGTGCPFG